MGSTRARGAEAVVLLLTLAGCSDDGTAASGTQGSSDAGVTASGSGSQTDGTTATTSAGTTASNTATTQADSSSDGSTLKLDLGPLPDVGEMPVEPIPTTCAAAASGASSVGCEFFAVDLDQLDGFDDLQFAVAVSNVQNDVVAHVTIEQRIGGAWTTVAGPMAIPSLDESTFLLPDLHQEGSGVLVGGSYRISADVPVVAYQFNPLNIEPDSASSDASLLLPVSSWDYINHVVGWEPLAQNGHGAYLTVVAAVDGTVVDITPTIATQAGAMVPAGVPGVAMQVSLDAGDVVELNVATGMETLSGTRVESDAEHPVAVFSGAECTFVLAYSCDHIEEQLTGVRQWGLDFVAARVPPRVAATPETSVWQIYASEDGTTVDFVGSAVTTGLPAAPVSLDAGELVTLEVGGDASEPGDFAVHADKPIAVVNYMTGSSLAGSQGDPVMVQLPPVEQYLPRYVVLVPTSWTTDVITLMREPGAAVVLDGVAVPDAAFVTVGAHEVARVAAADGVHVLEGDAAFGVLVAGYTTVDSYAYPGGLGTGVINPTPEG